MPFFTVVVPLFNKAKFIGAAIESILSQTFTDYEIIIVDDQSTDGGKQVVSNYTDPRIKVIAHSVNKGLSASRNTGVREAASKFIAFLDADDTWKPHFLRKIHEMISLFPDAGIFATAYEEHYPGNIVLPIRNNLELKPGEMNLVADFFTAASKQPILCYIAAVLKREVFETVGYFDETITLGEDVDYNIRANLNYSLAYYNIPSACYTIYSENQITKGNINTKKVTDFNKYESFVKQNPSLKTYLDINRYIIAMEYKLAGNKAAFVEYKNQIDPENLTSRQKFLLNAPATIARIIRKSKVFLLKNGIRLTSFRK